MTDAEIIQYEQEINKTQSTYINNISSHLKETQIHLDDARENYNNFLDMLNRTVIRSPVDGIVNNLQVHTKGGIIGQGQIIAEISPINDHLIVEAKIPPKNIDSVRIGLKAKMRFSAFKSRTTPIFTGTVISISPDIVQDREAAAQLNNPMVRSDNVYIARIEIDMDEFNKIAKARKISLSPGMEADIQIVTGTRTLLRYLLDPITDNMFKALIEK